MNKQGSRAEATSLDATVHVGKSGMEPELAEKLANLTDSELIEVRGNTAVFRRKG